MRLIDADALRKNLSSRFMNELYPDWRTLPELTKMRIELLAKEFRFAIDHSPTIDTVPVAHARWEKYKGGSYTYCSHCNACLPGVEVSEVFMDDEFYYNQEIEETNYCPYCGAKMDLGKD